MPSDKKVKNQSRGRKSIFIAELKSGSDSGKKLPGRSSADLPSMKGLIAAFCNAMFTAFDSDVVFYIAGKEMKPFLLELSGNHYLNSLDFINPENSSDFFLPCGSCYVFFQVKGNDHWGDNFCVASGIMAERKNGNEGAFTIFGPWGGRKYIVTTTYKNGDIDSGYMHFWLEAASVGFLFDGEIPSNENEMYEEGLFKANPAFRREMFALSWLGEEEPEPIAPVRSTVRKSSSKPELQPPGEIISANGISGKTFLFTGTLSQFTREEAEATVIFHGGKPLSGVSSKLNFLVAGEDPGSKLEKASANPNIRILSEAEFEKLIPTVLDSEGNPNLLLTRVNRIIMAELNEIMDESKSEFSGSFIEVNTRYGTYNLNETSGAYYRLLNGLVHCIMLDKELYHEFLNQDQIVRLEELAEDRTRGIFKPDEEEDDNYEFVQYEMLGRIYSSAFTFVARKLILLNLDVSDELRNYLGD